jgi:hypothetical protein
MAIQFVQKDYGGTIYHDVVDSEPARWDASPTPTVTIYAATGGELVASQSATEGASTTLAAAVSAGASTLTVASATGLSVGDTLMLGANSGGQYEWITVDSVNSSTKAIGTRDVLQYAYTTGDALKSHRLSVTLTAAEAGGVYENARAEWDYKVSTQQRTETTLFHITPWNPRMTLRDQDILIRNPRCINQLGTRQRLGQLIKEVWERDVLEELGVMFKPGGLVAGDAVKKYHLDLVLAQIAVMAQNFEAHEAYVAEARNSLRRVMSQTLVDTDADGNIDSNDRRVSMRCGRIGRGS